MRGRASARPTRGHADRSNSCARRYFLPPEPVSSQGKHGGSSKSWGASGRDSPQSSYARRTNLGASLGGGRRSGGGKPAYGVSSQQWALFEQIKLSLQDTDKSATQKENRRWTEFLKCLDL